MALLQIGRLIFTIYAVYLLLRDIVLPQDCGYLTRQEAQYVTEPCLARCLFVCGLKCLGWSIK